MQDAIGSWHDVMTLSEIAENLLGSSRPLVSLPRTMSQSRLNESGRVITKTVQAVRRMTEAPLHFKDIEPVPALENRSFVAAA